MKNNKRKNILGYKKIYIKLYKGYKTNYNKEKVYSLLNRSS